VLEPGFFAIGLLLAFRQRRGWLALLVAIASLNRETAVFLPVAYAVTSPVTKRTVATSAALLAIWAVVVLGVRYAAGEGDRIWTLGTIWAWNRNREHLWLTVQNATLLLGAFWIFAVLGFRRSSPFVRRSVWMIPPYMAAVLLWGVWSEVRLLTPLYPVVFSLALSYLFRAPSSGGVLPVERRAVIAAILVTAAGVNAYHYSFLVPRAAERIATHEAVVHHAAAAPERFRVLVPYAVEAVARPASMLMPYQKSISRVYAAYYLLALTALLLACFAYFTRWYPRDTALIGALLVADTVHIALRQGEYIGQVPIPSSAVFAPHSILEPTLIAATLIFTARGQWKWVTVVAGIAALNSEAALLVPLVALAGGGATNRSVAAATVSAGVAVGVLLLIRLIVGGPWTSMSLDAIWQMNVANLPTAAVNVLLLLGGAWVLAVFGYSRSPVFLRRVAMVVPVYAAVVGVCGFWWDVRLLLSLYPLVVPLALAFVA
jgi:hypothetical protein